MNILAVIGHQHPGSFCHAVVGAIVEELRSGGHDVVFHDLYAEEFDPVLTEDELQADAPACPVVRRHIEQLLAADGVVIVHPNWWAQPPAVLKGWIDRVFRKGPVYRFGAGGKVEGQLAGKKALVITTSNTPRDMELALYGDPLENLWKNCVFGFCGLTDFRRRNFESMVLSTPDQRRAWLDEARRLARETFSSPVS
ncbi:MAG: NAD(P)H-dependent oxidoreductase [Pirellulales bacterium]|nr:NAD(P)H-dependent oxidoreductase [Pirellulales bacterium]